MLTSKMLKDIYVFDGMAQFYRCFIKKFSLIMAPITKFLCKIEVFPWNVECQEVWEAIRQRYVDAPISIAPKWDMEFHVHTNMSNLAIEAMLAQNPIEKCDQPIAHASKLLNNAEKNYTTTEREALAMVYASHTFRHYLLGNKLFLTSTTWHYYTSSKSFNCQDELLGGCYYSYNMIFQWCKNQGVLIQWWTFSHDSLMLSKI